MSKKVTSVTVDLEYPFDLDGHNYTKLTFRRMKAKDTLVAENTENNVKAGFLMFAALAGVDVDVIEELDADDLETIGEKVAPLMGKSTAKLAAKLKAEEALRDGVT